MCARGVYCAEDRIQKAGRQVGSWFSIKTRSRGGVSMLTSPRSILAAALAVGCCATQPLFAQAVYGSIVGTVQDTSGGVVSGAKVTTRNVERDVTNTTTTNESGNYTQRYLIVGRYQVRVEAPGFQTFVQENVPVSVDSEARVDIRLQVGEVTQTLEVSADA